MPTRRLSQRVLTLSLPKVNRRKRPEMRYFCVLARRCGWRARLGRRNWTRRNSRTVTLQPQTGRSTTRRQGPDPPPGWRWPVRKKKSAQTAAPIARLAPSDELHNFRLCRCEKEQFTRSGPGLPRRAQILHSIKPLGDRCLSVVRATMAIEPKRAGSVVPVTLFRGAPPQVQLKSPVVLLDTAKSPCPRVARARFSGSKPPDPCRVT